MISSRLLSAKVTSAPIASRRRSPATTVSTLAAESATIRSDCARTDAATSVRIASIPPLGLLGDRAHLGELGAQLGALGLDGRLGGLRVAAGEHRGLAELLDGGVERLQAIAPGAHLAAQGGGLVVELGDELRELLAGAPRGGRLGLRGLRRPGRRCAADSVEPLDARAERAHALAAGLDLAADGGALLAGAAGVLAGGGGGLAGRSRRPARAPSASSPARSSSPRATCELAADARDGAAQLVGLGAAGAARPPGRCGRAWRPRRRGRARARTSASTLAAAAVDLGDALGGVAGGGERLPGLLAGSSRRSARAAAASAGDGLHARGQLVLGLGGLVEPGGDLLAGRDHLGGGAARRPRPRWRPRRGARRCGASARGGGVADGVELVARGEALGQRLDARDAGGQAVGGAGELLQARLRGLAGLGDAVELRLASAAALSTSSRRVPTPSAACRRAAVSGRPRELLELGLQRGGLGLRLPDGGGDLAAQLGREGAELLVLDGVGGQLDGDRGLVLAQRGADLGELGEGVLGGGAELLALGTLAGGLLLGGLERGLRGAQLLGDRGDLVLAAADLGLGLDDLVVAPGEVVLGAQDVGVALVELLLGALDLLGALGELGVRAADLRERLALGRELGEALRRAPPGAVRTSSTVRRTSVTSVPASACSAASCSATSAAAACCSARSASASARSSRRRRGSPPDRCRSPGAAPRAARRPRRAAPPGRPSARRRRCGARRARRRRRPALCSAASSARSSATSARASSRSESAPSRRLVDAGAGLLGLALELGQAAALLAGEAVGLVALDGDLGELLAQGVGLALDVLDALERGAQLGAGGLGVALAVALDALERLGELVAGGLDGLLVLGADALELGDQVGLLGLGVAAAELLELEDARLERALGAVGAVAGLLEGLLGAALGLGDGGRHAALDRLGGAGAVGLGALQALGELGAGGLGGLQRGGAGGVLVERGRAPGGPCARAGRGAPGRCRPA